MRQKQSSNCNNTTDDKEDSLAQLGQEDLLFLLSLLEKCNQHKNMDALFHDIQDSIKQQYQPNEFFIAQFHSKRNLNTINHKHQ